MVTEETILAAVAGIEASKGDPESAHAQEDELYRAVLQAIADGHESPALLAAAALDSQKVDFPRWCA
jgi:hypothetical protein